MQAYTSVGSGHGQAYTLPTNPATFYAAQTSPAYSAILPQAYGRSLKGGSPGAGTGLNSAAAGYYGSSFPVQAGQSPYAAYTGNPYNSAFSSSSSCSSPSFTQQQALDYTSYAAAAYPQNPAAYAAYYSGAYGQPYMSAAAASATNVVTQPNYQLAHLNINASDGHYSSTNAAATTPSPPLKENCSSATANKKSRNAKVRGRRQNNPTPPPEGDMERVFIWNLDETIIIFDALLSGQDMYAGGPDVLQNIKSVPDYAYLRDIAAHLEELIILLASKHLFHDDVLDCDQVHVDDVASDDNGQDLSIYHFESDGFRAVSPSGNLCMASGVRGGVDWMRKLAFRYRAIKDRYNQYRSNVGVLHEDKRVDWLRLRQQLDERTCNWSAIALKCLQMIADRENCTNVLVCSNPLVYCIAKVLSFGLGTVFPIENIYSSHKVGKENCFERVAQRFGRKCTYVVIGNSLDEERAAKTMNFAFWRISGLADLGNLHTVLDQNHM